MKKYFSGNLGNFSVGLIEKKKKTGNIEVCKKETTKEKIASDEKLSKLLEILSG